MVQWEQPVVLCDLLSVFDEKKVELAPKPAEPAQLKKLNKIKIMAELKAKLSTKLVFIPTQTKKEHVTCVEKLVTKTELPQIPLS